MLHSLRTAAAVTALLGRDMQEITVGGLRVPAVHLAHPGIVMRSEYWAQRTQQAIRAVIPRLRALGL
ncbi:MAG: hypothetical protein FJ029_03885 [Actinobacteria bacterium]|nr:hypothetical protein [Actinomycetota bacterium]